MISDTDRSTASGFLRVRLTTMSIALLCITVSAVASLAVVATITEADVLSTVALALAVLAFAAQLIVTVAQAQTSASQTRDTFEINAQTQAALADIQAQARALVAVQSSQFEKLLERAINPQNVADALAQATVSGAAGEAREVDPTVLASQLRSVVEGSVVKGEARVVWRETAKSNASAATSALNDFLRLSPVAQDLLRRAFEVGYLGNDALAFPDALNELMMLEFAEAYPVWSVPTREEVDLTFKAELLREVADPRNPSHWTKDIRAALHERFAAVTGAASPTPTG